jgi:hypothetical protein
MTPEDLALSRICAGQFSPADLALLGYTRAQAEEKYRRFRAQMKKEAAARGIDIDAVNVVPVVRFERQPGA